MKKDFLAVSDFSVKEITEIFKSTADMKKGKIKPLPLKNKATACIFHKPSLRTRISFEVGIQQLGGKSLYITKDEFKLGRKDDPEKREWFYDGAKVLSRMVDLIVIRTFEHSGVEELAKFAEIPVVNALTDLYHPCQIMGDMFTIWEKKKKIENISIAYMGDGNNVCNSWLDAASLIPLDLRIGTSPETLPDKDVLQCVIFQITRHTNLFPCGFSACDKLNDFCCDWIMFSRHCSPYGCFLIASASILYVKYSAS